MRILWFFLSLALAASFSCASEDKAVEVVGVGECADCAQNNFDTRQAFTGLRVTIDCKAADGHFKTRGSSELDEEGNFKVSLPNDIVKEGGELNEECYAQLHSALSTPCPAHESLESSKIVTTLSKSAQQHAFGLQGKLRFSPITCASKFFWHHFHNHPFFKLPCPPPKAPAPAPKKEKPCPPKEKPVLPPAPKKEKPCPPKEKPVLPPAPKKEKPCPPKEKPVLPPAPKKEKPCPPTAPVVKPSPPSTPTYQHPFYKHPIFNHPIFKHLPPPNPPTVMPKPTPTPTPTYQHPIYKHPIFNHPLFKNLPTLPHNHPLFPPHHP